MALDPSNIRILFAECQAKNLGNAANRAHDLRRSCRMYTRNPGTHESFPFRSSAGQFWPISRTNCGSTGPAVRNRAPDLHISANRYLPAASTQVTEVGSTEMH